jgi:hypothetical protein|nr:MAG TPA: hypothetical protein [Caudoviricetes sp.]
MSERTIDKVEMIRAITEIMIGIQRQRFENKFIGGLSDDNS